MTFSIVAVDKEAREIGMAIASCNWDARGRCMARAEAGAIASQGSGDQALLQTYFENLANGLDPETILRDFHASDSSIHGRQIGAVSFSGGAAAHTGDRCMPWAGHRIGCGYTCQGNILVGPEVVDAMAETFEGVEGPLYARLYAALSAGEAAGGDLRGKQSAGLVVAKSGYGQPGTDTMIDFSIEDHPEPVEELGRLVRTAENLLGASMLQAAFKRAEDDDRPALLARFRTFLEDKKDPRYLDAWIGLAKGYQATGDHTGAADALGQYLAISPQMRPVLCQQIDKGFLPSEWGGMLG